MKLSYDVIVIGAGAAGMMCAIEAGKRGRRVWLIDHAEKIAEKIRISGGGRCNFTNLHTKPENYLSQNLHFCKSALSQYTPQNFIDLMNRHGIAFHEKKFGQLFCDGSAQQIIDMLLDECMAAEVMLETGINVTAIEKAGDGYVVKTAGAKHHCASLVIATGGLSIPKIGASKFGYDVARQFGLNVVATRPGLVPLTFQSTLLKRAKALSGLSVEAVVAHKKTRFSEGLLFTHRGLSGPSILQISSYWQEGEEISVNFVPGVEVLGFFKDRKKEHPRQDIQTALSDAVPRRLAASLCEAEGMAGRMADLPDTKLSLLADAVNDWQVKPSGTEGYRTAEVTLGGVDTNMLLAKTMEAKNHAGLYFIGEVVDVTGHLGGFNFQWAWSSGYAAGQHV